MDDGAARDLLKQSTSWGRLLGPKQIATRVQQKVRAERLGQPEHPGLTRRKDVGAAEVVGHTEQVPQADLKRNIAAFKREKRFIRRMRTEHPDVWAETEKSIQRFLPKKSAWARELLKLSGRLR